MILQLPTSAGRAAGGVIQGSFLGGVPRLARPGAAGLQAVRRGHAFQVPAGLVSLAAGPGQPLAEPVRREMEDFFGTSFADVRVHAGHQAAALGAQALTCGALLLFAPACFQPAMAHGRRLLAHELAHVVQQRAGRVRNPFGTGFAIVHDSGLEAEAERLALEAVRRACAVSVRMAQPFKVPRAPAGPAPHVAAVLARTAGPAVSALQMRPAVPRPAQPFVPRLPASLVRPVAVQCSQEEAGAIAMRMKRRRSETNLKVPRYTEMTNEEFDRWNKDEEKRKKRKTSSGNVKKKSKAQGSKVIRVNDTAGYANIGQFLQWVAYEVGGGNKQAHIGCGWHPGFPSTLFVSSSGSVSAKQLTQVRSLVVEAAKQAQDNDIRALTKVVKCRPYTQEPTSNHAEMRIVLKWHTLKGRREDQELQAESFTGAQIRTTGPACGDCAYVMDTLGIGYHSTTGVRSKTGWRHPITKIAYGPQTSDDSHFYPSKHNFQKIWSEDL